MSIIKNPVFLALLATCIVFAVTYCYYNYYARDSVDPKDLKKSEKTDKKTESKNVKNTKKKDGIIINEVMILSSIIAGLVTWYIASSYFADKDARSQAEIDADANTVPINVDDVNKQMVLSGGKNPNKIPHLDSDDATRSYNLIGHGVNIPRSDLKLPKVFIDYK